MSETVNPQESVFMKPLIFLLPAVLSLHAAAQNYVIADDRLSSGVLTLEGSSFSVSTVNPNGNVCDYEGIVRNRIASDGEGCVVHFSFKRDSVRLDVPESAREACQSYCGHNAFFDGVYYKMPTACASKYAEAAERRFQAAYRDKRFREAANLKRQYLNQCGRFLYLTDWMRGLNDLAVSFKNAGDKAACRKTLAPLSEWLRDYRPNYINETDYKREASAARFNLKQCEAE